MGHRFHLLIGIALLILGHGCSISDLFTLLLATNCQSHQAEKTDVPNLFEKLEMACLTALPIKTLD